DAPAKAPRIKASRLTLRGLLGRVALALGSVLVTLLILEGVTRFFVTQPSPVQLREGLYAGQLAKVNGRDTVLKIVGAQLPEKKRDGEIRIFVFGESSIQGSPWGYYGSPPALLHDQLEAALPGRDLTVVNMGRGAGYMIDSYYFLVSIARFSPDYVVIYQGGNDTYRSDREMCMPASHPLLYRGVRWLVEHSRFVWTVRAEGPLALVKLRPPKVDNQSDSPPGAVDLCDDTTAFRGWSEILAETGRGMGAKVIMTTPVQSPLRWAEDGVALSGVDLPMRPTEREAEYQRLLGCVLTDGCDLAALWSEVRGTARRGEGYRRDFWGEPRPRAMLEAAVKHGARGIDFFETLKQSANGGLSPLLFSDEVHLTLEGYSRLAWLWTSRIGPDLGAAPLPTLPPPVDRERYLTDIFQHGGNGGFGGAGRYGRACLLLPWANLYLRANMALIAGSLLEQAVSLDVSREGEMPTTRAGLQAKLLIGWMRQLDGLDPQLPPALAARLGEVSIAEMTKQLREHPDCSTLGGDEPFPGEIRPRDAVEPSLHAIPSGNEAAFMGMLGGGEIAGCRFEGAEIRSTLVHASYRCAGGQAAVIELYHPAESPGALATTVKFALVAGDPAPPEALVRGLAARIQEREAPFAWVVVTRGDGSAPRPVIPGAGGRWRAPLLWGGPLVLAGLLLFYWQRRQRKRARL
ncbi:MAG: SGNH/GDSL hydrolase family protein, partial [Minicystis sp.]